MTPNPELPSGEALGFTLAQEVRGWGGRAHGKWALWGTQHAPDTAGGDKGIASFAKTRGHQGTP